MEKKSYLRTLSIILFLLTGPSSMSGQEPVAEPKPTPSPWIEQQYIDRCRLRDWSNKSINKTGWRARFNIIGDQPEYPNYNDAVFADLFYQVDGPKAVEPTVILVSMYTESRDPSRFPDDLTLAIYVDGKLLSSEKLRLEQTRTTLYTIKKFDVADIPYKDFLRIVEAKKVAFQLGEVRSDLTELDMKRIRDFNNTIERLPSVAR